MRTVLPFVVGGMAATALTPSALAQAPGALQPYVAVSAGVSVLGDSDNSGAFTQEFETGAGAGLTLPSGSDVGWTTEFDNGLAVAGALGARTGNFRGEVELAFQSNDVDTHTDVVAAATPLDAADAGILITGSDPLGVTVGDLVADGQGSVETVFVMANAYIDVPLNGAPIEPYVGAGLGLGFVDVDYSPSGVGIIDDRSTEFAYQVMAGGTVPLNDRTDVFAGYRFRGTSDAAVEVDLFPAELDIENTAHIFEVGVRFAF